MGELDVRLGIPAPVLRLLGSTHHASSYQGGEFEVGALYALKDVDAYRTYMYDPLHRQIDAAGLPLVATMVSMDLTDDEDPEIGEKIAQVHKDRFGDHPELLDLVENLDSYEGSGTSDGGATSA